MNLETASNFSNIRNIFGINVFSDAVMKDRLSPAAYAEFHEVLESGRELHRKLADEIAKAMKDWAIERGATHYTHWFQPLTETTAEKHDSFLDLDREGHIILDFSGKQLIKGEADASSFPSGGTRATFEARGYTVWDCTSPAFIREIKNGSTVLCIPTAFCSYNGEALDKKTPLLRAMQALDKQAVRVLRQLGNTSAKHVFANLGAEQEYFLIKKRDYNRRKDLVFTGRTLFGAKPPKGQELHDQYYASIRDCVSAFMNELNFELWKLGITAKTQHNEAAPSQHELAPVYTTTNIATDHNQLIMETMKRVADRNGLACILHEKPFDGVNGSGKHNNWSLCTDDGSNLLYPGKTPRQNKQFLVFFTSVIAAVNEYAELLLMSASHPGNDHRLGGFEAPPSIISVFIGEELQELLDQLEQNEIKDDRAREYLNIGVSTLPALSRDTSDRNRTSPFAFTGNKFEFRMVGSSASTATPNVILCTIVAEYLRRAADRLEQVKDKDTETAYLIRENIVASKRILFSGNNYSPEWVEEASRRGLIRIDNCVDAYACLTQPESVELFERHGVLNEVELRSRQEIYYESYIKTVNIEAMTMLTMAKNQIIPAACKYIDKLAASAKHVEAVTQAIRPQAQIALVERMTGLLNSFYGNLLELERILGEVTRARADNRAEAEEFRDLVAPQMRRLRADGDALETLIAKEDLPYPNYADLLFYD